jgi:hypothetical protein
MESFDQMTDEDKEKYRILELSADRLEDISRAAKRRGEWELVRQARQGIREARYKQRILESRSGVRGWGDHLFVLGVAAAAFVLTLLIGFVERRRSKSLIEGKPA